MAVMEYDRLVKQVAKFEDPTYKFTLEQRSRELSGSIKTI